MSIVLAFAMNDNPPRWAPDDTAKLEAAVEVLRRRHELGIDPPDGRRDIWNALGALWPVLAVASDDPVYAQRHPAEIDPADLPF